MIQNQWLAICLVGVATICILVTVFALLREARYRDLEERVLAVAAGMSVDHRAISFGGLGGLLRALGERVRTGTGLYSQDDLAGLESMIASSGLNPKRVLPIVLGGKVLLTVLTPTVAILYCYVATPGLTSAILIISASILFGMLGPNWILGALRRPYTAALQRGVIDALDLLVVCSEAGLGLESALAQVAREMQHSNRPTAAALNGLLDEIRLLPDRKEAFANFAKRSSVDGMQRLAAMLAQSLQYGTPLGQALRAVADQLRRDRIIKLEAQAAKLPAKLVLPLILFIMPCLFIILVGSSFLRLYDVLGTLRH